ncbi:hypothetical protein LV779_33590 [Streptomyces thinghirensis]|nr:hypothetical protein [Streptomyces thinghirensis]
MDDMDVMDLDTFRKLAADRRVIPVSRKLLADGDTPGSALTASSPPNAPAPSCWSPRRTAGRPSNGPGTPSSASAAPPPSPRRTDRPTGRAPSPVGVPTDGDPLATLRATVEALHTPRDLAHDLGLPPFTGGMVGYLGYDIVRRLEKVGPGERDDLKLPELTMLLTSDLAVMDHWEGSVLLIANAINHNDLETGIDEAYADAVARLAAMEADLTRAVAAPRRAAAVRAARVHRSVGRPRLPGGRRGHQGAHPRGRGLPGRASQRFETPCTASALDVYRVLRATNPSPHT